MISIAIAVVIAIVLSVYAHWKGRTGWHWFLLALCFFVAIWLLTYGGLYLTGVEVAPESLKLALFAGSLTGFIVLVMLISVPERRRVHAPAHSREAER